MNIRQLKRMHYSRYGVPAILFGQPMIEPSPAGMQMLAARPCVVLFVCHKVKDDEIVGEFNTRDEALALVSKHARQKKAKLYVMHAGQPVLFTEEEMAA